MTDDSPVYMFEGDDPAMLRASEKARATFRYFWRELCWERRRIVPALDLACVKAPFADEPDAASDPDNPQVEHMWISDVEFDGETVSGTLINSPNWLTSVSEGDPVQVPLSDISDWMYSLMGRVYGAFTVNLMRSRMPPAERAQHDEAWGLEFGDPDRVEVVPADFAAKDADAGSPEEAEHPMSLAMGPSLEEFLTENPDEIEGKDEQDWTMLHHQALAGDATSVGILLSHGADPTATTDDGKTPLDLAESLRWDKVAALLRAAMKN